MWLRSLLLPTMCYTTIVNIIKMLYECKTPYIGQKVEGNLLQWRNYRFEPGSKT